MSSTNPVTITFLIFPQNAISCLRLRIAHNISWSLSNWMMETLSETNSDSEKSVCWDWIIYGLGSMGNSKDIVKNIDLREYQVEVGIVNEKAWLLNISGGYAFGRIGRELLIISEPFWHNLSTEHKESFKNFSQKWARTWNSKNFPIMFRNIDIEELLLRYRDLTKSHIIASKERLLNQSVLKGYAPEIRLSDNEGKRIEEIMWYNRRYKRDTQLLIFNFD